MNFHFFGPLRKTFYAVVTNIKKNQNKMKITVHIAFFENHLPFVFVVIFVVCVFFFLFSISNSWNIYELLQGSQGTNHHVTNNCQTTDGNGSNSANLNGNGNGTGTDEDVWRGHSIAALRRRASELNNSIPSYLHQNYDHHHNSVY